MARVRIEETNAAITYTGTWGAGASSDTTTYSPTQVRASGGAYKASATAGGTASIAVPAGTTSVLLHAPYQAYNYQPTVAIDGGVLPVWNQWNHTSDSGVTMWDRACYPPIYITDGAAHTVTITVGNGGAALDCVDFYTAEAPTNTVTGIGHSIMYGYPGTGTVPVPFCQGVAALLGCTAINNGLSSETLAQADTATAYTGAAGMMQGWVRADTYATWEGTKPRIALIMYGINDVRLRGDNDPAGGGTYGLAQFQQRLRELIWKINCNTPSSHIVVIGSNWLGSATWGFGAPYTHGGTYDGNGSSTIWRAWDAGMAAVCAEATSLNTTFVPLMALTSLRNSAILSDGTHPNQEGATLIAAELYNRLASLRAPGSHGRGGAF